MSVAKIVIKKYCTGQIIRCTDEMSKKIFLHQTSRKNKSECPVYQQGRLFHKLFLVISFLYTLTYLLFQLFQLSF